MSDIFKKIFRHILFGLGVLLFLIVTTMAFGVAYELDAEPTLVNKTLEFQNELRIPPLAEPIMQDGKKIFELKLEEGETEFFDGTKTATWGANGTYLMPTIRAHEGDDVEMRVTNALGEKTTIHWHGMHLPSVMDGVHQLIEPGETWAPYWQIRQQAATLWYHPHLMGQAGFQVYKGLAGMFILDDTNSDNLDIPKEYGVDDLPLIIQDRRFNERGQFVYRRGDSDIYGHVGMIGDTILVNGTHAPYVDVPGKLIRLRILNGSNARRYNFGFSDDRIFYQIASDGGYLEEPVPRSRMMLSAGERAEILVDMSNLEPVTLMSYEVESDKSVFQKFVERILRAKRDEGQVFKIIALQPQVTAQESTGMPQTLNTITRWNEKDAIRTRTFVLGGDNRINGERMQMGRIDEVVRLGTREIWEIKNPSGSHHPFHIHDVQFQILDRNDKTPPSHEQGWKDTVFVDQDETVRVIMEFKDYADPHVAYMYHCHILEHEDHGMMGQFVVVDDEFVTPELRTEAVEKGIEQNTTDH